MDWLKLLTYAGGAFVASGAAAGAVTWLTTRLHLKNAAAVQAASKQDFADLLAASHQDLKANLQTVVRDGIATASALGASNVDAAVEKAAGIVGEVAIAAPTLAGSISPKVAAMLSPVALGIAKAAGLVEASAQPPMQQSMAPGVSLPPIFTKPSTATLPATGGA